jgi:uncharacterized membrane protein
MANINIGKTRLNVSSCHRLPERSFFWKGQQFPICARCTGIYIGLLSLPLFWLFWSANWIVGLLLIAPTVIDGLSQAMFGRESTNWLRMTTGILAGVGLTVYSVIIGMTIGNFLLSLSETYLIN